MSSLTVSRSNLQLLGAKDRFLQLVKKNGQYCPSCDGYGYIEFNFGDELIHSTCHVCVEFSMQEVG